MRNYLFLILSWFAVSDWSEALSQIPTIGSLSTTSGTVGSLVTITGNNFDAVPSNNIVRFGSVEGMVTSASTTQLIVAVPAGGAYAPISVTVNGLTSYSVERFTTSFPSPGAIGTFKSHADLIAPNNLTYSVTTNDMDGDGRPDVLVGYAYGNLSIFRNQTLADGIINFGDVSTRFDLIVGSVSSAIFLCTGDLDGDGRPELIAARFADGLVTVFRNTSVAGVFSFAAGVDIPITNPVHPVVADLDLDGKAELIVPNAITDVISVIRNSSTPGNIVSGSFSVVDFTVGSEANDVAVVDLDGDGKPDLACSNSGESTLSILRNTSTPGSITTGSFAPRITLTEVIGTAHVRVGDLDLDGKPDIIAGLYNALENKIIVHKNNCTPGAILPGSFAAPFELLTNYLPAQDIEIADFDGDARPDLATISNGQFSVFRNISSPGVLQASSFAGREDISASSIPNQMTVADLSGEGKPDVVISDRDLSALHVRKNLTGFTPVITNFSPSSGRKGAMVTITGQYFDGQLERNSLLFNNTPAIITSVLPTQIVAVVPVGATSGPLKLSCDELGVTSSSNFTFIPAPVISGFSPSSGRPGVEVTISGTGFETVAANNIVKIGTIEAQVNSSTATQIRFTIPLDAVTGNVSVAVSTDETIGGLLTVLPPPLISLFTPTSGAPGTLVTITGEHFDIIPSRNKVTFNGINAVVTLSTTTSLTAIVPTLAATGKIAVQIDAVSGMSADDFTVTMVTGDLEFIGIPDTADWLVMYPNPANKEITVGLEKCATGVPIHVEVIDMSGRKIAEVSAVGGMKVSFDVSAYSTGLYIVRVVSDGLVKSKYFVKD